MKTVISKEKLIGDLTKAKKHYEECKAVLEKDGGGFWPHLLDYSVVVMLWHQYGLIVSCVRLMICYYNAQYQTKRMLSWIGLKRY